MQESYVIGVDFGSDSVRASVIQTSDGRLLSTGVAYYPRWKQGLYQHPDQHIFRQHPLDYLETLEQSIQEALNILSAEQKKLVAAIGVDTTGSTPVPVNQEGTPLALTAEFSECEDAMFHLWKDHCAAAEAEEINQIFAAGDPYDYTKYQGRYSSEWFWAKILHTTRKNDAIRRAAYTWVEHCDWMVGLLCGNVKPETMYHSACAAGHKALWHSEWSGLPDAETLTKLDPYLALVRERYGNAPQPAVVKAGTLTEEWADKLGLSTDVCISGCTFDAHAGAIGAGIKEKTMICTIGTSAADMIVAPPAYLHGKDMRAYGGQAENSILPGYVGLETGQAAFGDIFAWFKRLLMWPIRQSISLLEPATATELYETMENKMLSLLEQEAAALPDAPFPIALDWFNGRRYPNTDDTQTGVIQGLTLGTTAPQIYRSLVFGAVCGLKRIVAGFEAAGLEIDEVIAVGGISKKSNFVMQMMADVLNKTIAIVDSDQTCALGAALYASAACGIYANIETASAHMAAKKIKQFRPVAAKAAFYETKYQEYLTLAMLVE